MPDERRRPHARRDRAADHLLVVGVAVACGLAGAGAAIGLRFLIFVFQSFFFGHGMPDLGQFLAAEGPSPLPVGAEVTWLRRLWAPILGGVIVGPMIFGLAREAQGHGVPEVMVAIARRGGMIRPRVVAVKTVASAITIASGGSVGREGPIVQIGSAVGSVIGQLLRMPTRQVRTLVGCGAAAGIAATFNAPIAGALFATEIILGDFAAGQLTPIVIASVVATVVSRAVLGDTPSFVVPAWELVNPWELAAYSGLGVISAGVGLGFGSLLLACENFFAWLRVPDMVKPALGGIAVGIIGIGFPHVFGSGYESINATLQGRFPLLLLAALLVAKVVATSVTLGSGGSGGIFAPALFLGAVTGGAFGHAVHAAFPASTASSGAYALVAMGAVVSAATHAPITAIIMMFEMTQSITIIPPLMTSCVIATLVAVYARRESIYTMRLAQQGVDVYADKDPNVLRSLFVRDLVDREPELVPAGATFQEVLDLVVRSRHAEFFVVDEKQQLLGAISVSQLRRLLFEEEALRYVVVAADLLETGRPRLRESDDLDSALQLFSHAGVPELAVVADGEPRRIVGVLHERDVVEAYHREMLRRDLAGGLSSRVGLAGRGQEMDLGGGYVLAEVEAPRAFAGRSLRQIDLRAQHGVQVLLVRARSAEGMTVRVPAPEESVSLGDVLVVAGPAEAVERLERAEQ